MQLKLIIAAALGLSANASFNKNAPEMKTLWSAWKQVYTKTYDLVEEAERFDIFAENYLDIVSHNADHTQSFKKGLNQFSDLTGEEFKSIYASGLLNNTHKIRRVNHHARHVGVLPLSVDWREKGAVTGVKNQGQCGSCWSFSSTGALEGLNYITTSTLLSFSEQQLVDCEKPDKGCNGGLMDHAFAYTAQKGVQVESDYPYKAKVGTCQYDASKTHQVNKAYADVAKNDVTAFKTALVQQPVSIAIEADQNSFQSYSSGVITKGCGAKLDHGVLAVGYTLVGTTEAFIVKNSWADTWGDNGYVMISTDDKANAGAGVCGILSDPSYPTA